MADNNNKPTATFSLITTTASRLRELVIKNGQLIFIPERNRIAFDWNGKRTFYNSIEVLETEDLRASLENPFDGYYFIVDEAVLWRYDGEWIQVTQRPERYLFVDVTLPELGSAEMLYVNKKDREISVWDDDKQEYVIVSNYVADITADDIESLFV